MLSTQPMAIIAWCRWWRTQVKHGSEATLAVSDEDGAEFDMAAACTLQVGLCWSSTVSVKTTTTASESLLAQVVVSDHRVKGSFWQDAAIASRGFWWVMMEALACSVSDPLEGCRPGFLDPQTESDRVPESNRCHRSRPGNNLHQLPGFCC